MPKVSVIVPVYNVEKYLRTCFDSLLNQTLDDLEIIVVNDGTKDNSQWIIDSYVNKYPNRMKGYIKENGGLSSARNFGIEKAGGDYIAFVDSDDWVESTMYEELYRKAVQHDFDIVMCDFNEIRNGKAQACSCKLHQDIFDHQDVKQAMVDFYPSAWNKLFKKELLIKTQTYFKEGVWFEDVEFIYRLLPYVDRIGIVNKHFYNYLIREGSITATADQRIYHYIDNWNGIIKYYQDHHLYDEYKDILEYCYVRYLLATFIKTGAKFNFASYKAAVKTAIQNVKLYFPNYKKNCYIEMNNKKNLYLKYFSYPLGCIMYFVLQKKGRF